MADNLNSQHIFLTTHFLTTQFKRQETIEKRSF